MTGIFLSVFRLIFPRLQPADFLVGAKHLAVNAYFAGCLNKFLLSSQRADGSL